MTDRPAVDEGTGLRVLVMSAGIGEGPLTVARSLRRSLDARPEVAPVELTEDLTVLGARFGDLLTRGYRRHLEQIGWTYDLAYRIFAETHLPRRAGQFALAGLSERGLAATVAAHRPDLVVADFPAISGALGQLRALGRFALPVISVVCDPAGLQYWAHPGIDMHLLVWPESEAEVEAIAGPGRSVRVAPLLDARFASLPSRSEALASLARAGLLPERWEPASPLVLVSGGGWGLGDLSGAVLAGLAQDARVIAIAGHNAGAEAELRGRFGTDDRVRVLGFSDAMGALLCAADAVVHTTGGTTALEARLAGCPLVNYGTGVAHVRAHAATLADRGLAGWAQDRGALDAELARTLAAGRRAPMDISGLPDAAQVIVDLGLGRR